MPKADAERAGLSVEGLPFVTVIPGHGGILMASQAYAVTPRRGHR